jgi:hypothetical protein
VPLAKSEYYPIHMGEALAYSDSKEAIYSSKEAIYSSVNLKISALHYTCYK